MSKPAPIDFRAAIRAALDAQGMTIRELAHASGVHETRVSQYLSGHRDAYGGTIARMLDALGVSVALKR